MSMDQNKEFATPQPVNKQTEKQNDKKAVKNFFIISSVRFFLLLMFNE